MTSSKMSPPVAVPELVATIPATTGSEYSYRVVYFKYKGCLYIPSGSVPWDLLVSGSFKSWKMIDLPKNFDISGYKALPCPNIVREHVASWLNQRDHCLGFLGRQEAQREW